MSDRLREFYKRMKYLTRLEWRRIVQEKDKFDLAAYATSQSQEDWARNNPWLPTEWHKDNDLIRSD